MRVTGKLIGALMLGAGVMYLFDADRGARRRAVLRDRSGHAVHRAGEEAGKQARHLRNRARGAVAEARSRVRHAGEPVSDEVLVERVRSALGRVVSHASGIEVSASGGRVRLGGTVEEGEVAGLLRAVKKVRGVEEVYDQMGTSRA